jgi:hypothetical protein
MLRRLSFVLPFATLMFCLAAMRVVSADAPVPYETFVKGAQGQHGLFTVWRKDGKVYLELSAAQLDHDFVQTIVPGNGLGGHFVVWGNTDHLPAEIVRFERAGNDVAIVWPNPAFVAPRSPAATRAIEKNFARSIVGLAPIAAEDEKTGTVVIDAAPFLDDQLNLKAVLAQGLGGGSKGEGYSLLKDRTYFGKVKAFPENVFIEAKQAWTSESERASDAPADPRYVQMSVVYNIVEPPGHADYRPRYADDRVGIYDDVYLSFDDDRVLSRKLRYIVRWDLQPSDPSKPVSPAKHPMVFVMSDTIPEAQRPGIRAAVLKWNDAFLKIGISDALQVVDQPKDPDWDPLQRATLGHGAAGELRRRFADPLRSAHRRRIPDGHPDLGRRAGVRGKRLEIRDRSRPLRPLDRSDAAKIPRRYVALHDHARDRSQPRHAAQLHRFARVHGRAITRSRVHGEVRHRIDRDGVRADQSVAEIVRPGHVRADGSRPVRLLRDALGVRTDSGRGDARRRDPHAARLGVRVVGSALSLRIR